MAGDWLKFDKTTPDKPEVFVIAGILGIDPDAVVGKLLRVWSWFDSHTDNGNAPVTVVALLDRLAGVTGFVNATVEAGWAKCDGNQIVVPNFWRHNGQTAKTRALGKNRSAAQRSESNAKSNDASVTPALPEKRREEKRGKKENKARGSESEVKSYAASLGLPESDGEACFFKWKGNGWTNNGDPMKCWKSTMRNWKLQGFLPSQKKPQADLFGKPAKTHSHANSYNEPTDLP